MFYTYNLREIYFLANAILEPDTYEEELRIITGFSTTIKNFIHPWKPCADISF